MARYDGQGNWLIPAGSEPKEGEVLDDLQFAGLKVLQRQGEYCFSSDAALLANFAKATSRERVVELCAGSGVISIILAAKCRPKEIVAVELNEVAADRCMRSIVGNGLSDRISVWAGDVARSPEVLGQGFDVVVANPPYFPVGMGEMPQTPEVAMSRFEVALTLEQLIRAASRLLRYGGRLYMVYTAARMAELLSCMRQYGIEPKTVYTVSPSSDADADVVLVEGKRGGRPGVKVRAFLRETLQQMYYRQDGGEE